MSLTSRTVRCSATAMCSRGCRARELRCAQCGRLQLALPARNGGTNDADVDQFSWVHDESTASLWYRCALCGGRLDPDAPEECVVVILEK